MRCLRAFCVAVCLWSAGLLCLRTADFEIINTLDSGFGSLRQAIEDANDNPGSDRIVFNIPGSGVRTIRSNSFGTLASQPAELTMLSQPIFVFHPLSQTVASGEWVNVSVSLSDFTTPPIGFRWRSNGVFVTHSVGSALNSFFSFRAGSANTSVSVVVSNPVARLGIGDRKSTR